MRPHGDRSRSEAETTDPVLSSLTDILAVIQHVIQERRLGRRAEFEAHEPVLQHAVVMPECIALRFTTFPPHQDIGSAIRKKHGPDTGDGWLNGVQ